MDRNNGNRYTAKGECATDKMYAFITKWPRCFSSVQISEFCGVSVNRASDFLRCMYKKSKIDKVGLIGDRREIYYKLRF